MKQGTGLFMLACACVVIAGTARFLSDEMNKAHKVKAGSLDAQVASAYARGSSGSRHVESAAKVHKATIFSGSKE